MLSQRTIALVKQSLPLLADAGVEVTEHFYQRMFAHNPELLDVFNLSNQRSGKQQFALFNALAAYATYIDQPEVLTSAIARINHKHASLGIAPHHYPIVGEHLLATLREKFPEQFNTDIEKAWAEAYAFLADLFITQEEGIYQQAEQLRGGWRGTRRFYISKIVTESELVKSFYLAPCDERAVMPYQAGQYLAVCCSIPTEDNQQIRQYSLSHASNNRTYRISVKRDNLVSGYLHSLPEGTELDIMPVAGDFVLKHTEAPKVLISAGVGITPMMAMLHTLAERNFSGELHFLHACRSPSQLSFSTELAQAASSLPALTTWTWIEEGATGTNSEKSSTGRMLLAPLSTSLPFGNGEFYLCGPTPFMADIKQQLLALGVDESRILYEVFGPHETL
ncbi:NO-inducible flavohemoprotein [Pseudoalteromonas rubra]|uniref:nitric oxide dioxygenase n=1 Tax=Pseudoalteromonas rubra TaxID=43658 RepID=A0A5S3WK14_9GAMM|nr:NO-inducible flavohemoprotein [Pseudoalteromonas rubra]TMP27741.1 NO-inducible flavohemoprotein [Pseudoalteromonas rubra]TMP32469.1 NO-inducible flavohemoprotein [Pseudoalteromonas rubra]